MNQFKPQARQVLGANAKAGVSRYPLRSALDPASKLCVTIAVPPQLPPAIQWDSSKAVLRRQITDRVSFSTTTTRTAHASRNPAPGAVGGVGTSPGPFPLPCPSTSRRTQAGRPSRGAPPQVLHHRSPSFAPRATSTIGRAQPRSARSSDDSCPAEALRGSAALASVAALGIVPAAALCCPNGWPPGARATWNRARRLGSD